MNVGPSILWGITIIAILVAMMLSGLARAELKALLATKPFTRSISLASNQAYDGFFNRLENGN